MGYYVLKYRRAVVWRNLQNSFPEKSDGELRLIEKKFYRNLADIGVETIKALSIERKYLDRRVKVDHTLPRKFHDNSEPVFVMTSHLGNWEWLLLSCSQLGGYEVHAVYQKLRNEFFNNFMLILRSRFGAIMHDKDFVIKDLIHMKGEHFLMAMVADQRPFSGENKYWTTFLNQDSAFYSGTELLARRFDIKVIYASMRRMSRGHYEVKFFDVETDPKSSPKHAITEKFIRFVEQDIKNDPASYLWSHDRWKLKKPTR